MVQCNAAIQADRRAAYALRMRASRHSLCSNGTLSLHGSWKQERSRTARDLRLQMCFRECSTRPGSPWSYLKKCLCLYTLCKLLYSGSCPNSTSLAGALITHRACAPYVLRSASARLKWPFLTLQPINRSGVHISILSRLQLHRACEDLGRLSTFTEMDALFSPL